MNRLVGSLSLLLALAAASVVLAEGPLKPSLRDPFPFDHSQHARTFQKEGLTCVSCHPVGLDAQLALTGPRSSCHGCHLAEFAGAPRQATDYCTTCHARRDELIPPDHGHDWAREHGAAAPNRGGTCETCHTRKSCNDCHDQRGPGTRNPHPPGFTRTHGVDARLDPYACTTCHSADTCSSCHLTGVRPW